MNEKSVEYDKHGNVVFRAYAEIECALCAIPIKKGKRIMFVDGKPVHRNCWKADGFDDDHTEDSFSIF